MGTIYRRPLGSSHVVFMCGIAAPSFAAPAASHPLNPCRRDIDNNVLVFVVIVAGGRGREEALVGGSNRFGGQRRRGLERILSTSHPLQGGRDHERHLVINGVRDVRGGLPHLVQNLRYRRFCIYSYIQKVLCRRDF